MKNVKIALTSLLVGSLVLTTSCSDDDSPEQGVLHGEPNIVEITVTDGEGMVEVYKIHGEGDHDHDKTGNKEEEDEVEISLYANSTYSVKVRLLNDEEDPENPEDITPEILEEKDEHFIVFSKEAGVNLTVARTDDASSTRADGNKIGFRTDWTTGAASPEGDVEIKLYHLPTDVSEAVTGDGNDFGSVGAGSETDLEVHFGVTIVEEPPF